MGGLNNSTYNALPDTLVDVESSLKNLWKPLNSKVAEDGYPIFIIIIIPMWTVHDNWNKHTAQISNAKTHQVLYMWMAYECDSLHLCATVYCIRKMVYN